MRGGEGGGGNEPKRDVLCAGSQVGNREGTRTRRGIQFDSMSAMINLSPTKNDSEINSIDRVREQCSI